MKMNFRPSKVAFIDFETQSEADLRKTTAKKYAKDPSTRVLTCVVRVDGRTHCIGPYLDGEAKSFLTNVASSNTLVAHNAPFDAAVWEAAGLREAEWYDTMLPCRAAGLPGGLDAVGKELLGRGKDANGKRLIDLLCCLRPGQHPPATGPAHSLLMEYNKRDTEMLEPIYEATKEFCEPDVSAVDRAINDRGIPIDRNRLEQLQELFEVNGREQSERFAELTDGTNPRSPVQMKKWLESLGFHADSVGKDAIAKLKADPGSYYSGDNVYASLFELEEAMEVRKDTVAAGAGKAKAALEVLDSDDRARDQLVYWGAHTGRWSSRRLQVHNMPCTLAASVDARELPTDLESIKLLVSALNEKLKAERKPKLHIGGILNLMLRSVVRCDNLLVADYAQVELRKVAWLASSSRMLNALADPKASIYLDMGERLFGRRLDKQNDAAEYALCKAIVLGCGYGMSGVTFEKINRSRDVDTSPLERQGLTAADCVKVFRGTYKELPILWKAYGIAVLDCVRFRKEIRTAKCTFSMVKDDMHVALPSGRKLVYRGVHIGKSVPKYCTLLGMPPIEVETVFFKHPKGYRGFLYGSRVCENVDQASCRDFIAAALIRCEQLGLNPVLHVHDEVVCEAPESRFGEFMEVMSTCPPWAEGFPLLCEGYTGPVWSKITDGYSTGKYMLGRRV